MVCTYAVPIDLNLTITKQICLSHNTGRNFMPLAFYCGKTYSILNNVFESSYIHLSEKKKQGKLLQVFWLRRKDKIFGSRWQMWRGFISSYQLCSVAGCEIEVHISWPTTIYPLQSTDLEIIFLVYMCCSYALIITDNLWWQYINWNPSFMKMV